MELIALTSNKNLEGIWNKKPIFLPNPLLVQHKTHLQTKSTLNHSDNMLAKHTNENKQFWPKYWIMNITKKWENNIFIKKTCKFVYLALFMVVKGSN